MSSFKLEPPKTIINRPPNKSLDDLVKEVEMMQEYQESPSFRSKCFCLIDKSRELYDGQNKLTYQNAADMFDVSLPVIKRAYANEKSDYEGKTRPNGRPFGLTDDEIERLKDWVSNHNEPPKYDSMKIFIANKFHKILDYRAVTKAMTKVGVKTEEASGIDEDRYYCKSEDIDIYYAILTEGHEEFVDAKKKDLVVVPIDAEKKEYHFPIHKRDDHSTFVACIVADGSYFKPLIVVKRKTIEVRVLRLSIADKVMIMHEETGYINNIVFDEWIDKIFIPEVQEKGRKYHYNGPAVLILDGCSSHYTDRLFELCDENNIRIFFIPAHSSNQTQMLDLGTFHLHKENVRKVKLTETEDNELLLQKIVLLLDSFQRLATYKNIRGAFEVAGAVFEVSTDNSMPIVCFSKAFTTKLWHCPRTREEIKDIREKRKGKGETEPRIKLTELNKSLFEQLSPKAKEASQKVPHIIDTNSEKNLYANIINALVPLLGLPQKQTTKIKRGRPKKNQANENKIDSNDIEAPRIDNRTFE